MAVRIAKKAVQNGCEPCGLVRDIGVAVGCPCARECDTSGVGEAAAALREIDGEYDDLLERLKDEFELKVEPDFGNDGAIKRLLKRLNFARRAVILLNILYDFLETTERKAVLETMYKDQVALLVECLEEQRVNDGSNRIQ